MMNAVEALMARDGLTREQAEQEVLYARDLMAEANFDPDECEDIMCNILGLELDYIFSVIW